MQPGVHYPLARAQKRITRFATKATIAPPKIINLLRIVNAPAQATHPMPRKSAGSVHKNIPSEVSIVCTRVRCLECSMRFSQNAKLLSPQGLFISSIDHQEPSISLQYLAPLQSMQPDIRHNEALSAKPKNPGHTKAIFNISLLTSTLIPSTHSPITSLSVTITDAVGTSKPHCYLVPILWDLMGANIKVKQ
jgi:hypothetical protein